MKVLLITEYYPPFAQGGGEISAKILAEALSEHGVEVSILTSYFKDSLKKEATKNITIYRYLTTGTSPKSLASNIIRSIIFPISVKRETKKLIEEENFDVIHYLNTNSVLGKMEGKTLVHVNSPVFFCPKGTLMYQDKEECNYKCAPQRFLRCFLKSKEFSKMKNKWYLKYNPLLHFYLYYNYKKRLRKLKQFNNYIAVSEFIKERLIKENISKDKIKVISNIVEIKDSKIKINTLPKLVYIGAYVENKGPLILINALNNIKQEYQCNFYGEGPLQKEMEDLAINNKKIIINSQVPYEKVEEIVRENDIVIQPSLVAEALPRVLIEAMGFKKTVITTNRGAMKYLIADEIDGLIFNPEKDDSLEKTIVKSLNINLRKKLGENACKKIKGRASKEKVTSEIINLYSEIKHL